VQERLTGEIANAIQTALNPRGTAVIIEGFHTCMAIRGVQQTSARMITSAYRGCLEKDSAHQSRFVALVNSEL
jgi:GTP cyclohydrolase IA